MEIQRVDKQRSERRFSNAKLQLMHIMDSVDDILQVRVINVVYRILYHIRHVRTLKRAQKFGTKHN